jgi:hypothetical protein
MPNEHLSTCQIPRATSEKSSRQTDTSIQVPSEDLPVPRSEEGLQAHIAFDDAASATANPQELFRRSSFQKSWVAAAGFLTASGQRTAGS